MNVKIIAGSALIVYSTSIDTLSDVQITNLQNGQILSRNSTLQKWVNINNTGGGGDGTVTSVNGQTPDLEGNVVIDASDIGLGSVDNTSDAAKPVSTAQNAAITAVAAQIPTNTNQLTNGAGFVTSSTAPVRTVNGVNPTAGNVQLTKANIGLTNVDDTADTNKPVSSPQQSALDLKEPKITAGTTGQYYRGDKTFADLNKAAVGLNLVDNTADSSKPVSTAQALAIGQKLTTPTGSPTTDYLNGVGAPVARPKYEALSALPGDLSGYPDGSRIVITG